MQEDNSKVTYISYQNGRAKIVTQTEWEQSWLEWWKRSSPLRAEEIAKQIINSR